MIILIGSARNPHRQVKADSDAMRQMNFPIQLMDCTNKVIKTTLICNGEYTLPFLNLSNLMFIFMCIKFFPLDLYICNIIEVVQIKGTRLLQMHPSCFLRNAFITSIFSLWNMMNSNYKGLVRTDRYSS